MQQNGAARFDGQAGGLGFFERVESPFSNDGDVEAHVVSNFWNFDNDRALPAELAAAPDGFIGSFERFDCEDHPLFNDDGLANVEVAGVFNDAPPDFDIGEFSRIGRAFCEQSGLRHVILHEGTGGQKLHAGFFNLGGDAAKNGMRIFYRQTFKQIEQRFIHADAEEIFRIDLSGHDGVLRTTFSERVEQCAETANVKPDDFVGDLCDIAAGFTFKGDGGNMFDAAGAGGEGEQQRIVRTAGNEDKVFGRSVHAGKNGRSFQPLEAANAPVPVFSNGWNRRGRLIFPGLGKTPTCCRPARFYTKLFMSYPPEIKRALRVIILAQCAGVIPSVLFGNGFMLAYFSQLGMPGYRILFLFALIPLIGMTLTLPLAWLADRTGKKRLGSIGIAISTAGFLMLVFAPFIPRGLFIWLASGILIFSAGNTANGAGWFALLSPIVPEEIRGRWFGRLRTSFQTTSILFSVGVAVLLKTHATLPVFQTVLLVAGLLLILRMRLYAKIPELEPIRPLNGGFWVSLHRIMSTPGYRPFCVYIFLLSFLTGAIPSLLGLLQREALGFSDSQLILMGNMLAAGTIAGFFVGGKMVDRFGAKPVFLAGHIVFAMTLTGVLLRGFIPLSPFIIMSLISLLCGSVQGATGIAGTSELLALIPPENKSLSTGFNMTMAAAGLSMAGLLNGHLLKIKVLPEQWSLFHHTLSAYDALLAGFTVMAVLMAATLGLVPTIRNLHSQWMPQNR